MKKATLLSVALIVLSGVLSLLNARVLKIEIDSRQQVLNGQTFGEFGAYELIKGKIFYGLDPDNPFNKKITDLSLAPRNAEGLVEAWGSLVVLQPLDRTKSSGVALVEVSNRGGKFSPNYFNRSDKGKELQADDPAYWGDALLMRQGLTVIWVGWQFDVPDNEHILKLHVPKAINPDGSSIEGWGRSDWTVDQTEWFLSLGHRAQAAYAATDLGSKEHQLTVRDGRDAPRQIIPRAHWEFAKLERGLKEDSDQHIYMKTGFQEGKIYELVYKARDPVIVGFGLAAIRDVISYAKYDPNCIFPIKQGIAAGVSQTGRFLRHFLYQGFNTDEEGRKAYDGMMIITAGAGRGSFNHRFGQPSRDAHRYSAFFYPTDIYPFTSREQSDPLSGEKDGLLSHLHQPDHTPKIFYINTGYEYWGRAASLIHISSDGQKDIEPLPNERIYHLASGQHFVDRWPPRAPMRGSNVKQYRGNPLEIKVNYRALLLGLKNWVEKNEAPPPSRYPKIADGSLIAKEDLAFPEIPGVSLPTTIHNAYRVNYGSRWSQGIVDNQPPELGYAFPSLVAQVDSFGNEMGGIQNIETQVPLATFTPWNLRIGYKGGSHELTDFRGTFIPLPQTEAQRSATKDPRTSLDQLYPTKEDYIKEVKHAAQNLVRAGYLLQEDVEYVSQRAQQYWQWLQGTPYEGFTQGPKNGTLMIIGGGRLDAIFYEKFMEAAGGPEAPIVVIPTAGGDQQIARDTGFFFLKKRFTDRGFKNVTILHTRNPKVADTEDFVEPIRQAGGVWFLGGRQWRLADSYLNTTTHTVLKELLDRGGVIAGSSAGATIQGSYLARGDTKGNTLMMGDHEEGLSFISNIAIDQHLLVRNRQFDLFEILEHHPELLGIGLDENTGIVVNGNQFEVMGNSYVVIFDGKKWSPERKASFPLTTGEQKFYFLRAGDKYDLSKRQVILK